MSFESSRQTGAITEGYIAKWLMARGNAVMPAYQIEKETGKGPQLFSSVSAYVAPDFIAFGTRGVFWIEAKHKSVWTWHRNTQHWTTGIDLRHYADYLRVAQQTRLPVWLMFFHQNDQPNQRDVKFGCPRECPVGLYGGEIFDLVAKENHRSPPLDIARDGNVGHGRSGMVYWKVEDLRFFAKKEDVMKAAA